MSVERKKLIERNMQKLSQILRPNKKYLDFLRTTRKLSTWSPLATVFNSRPTIKLNLIQEKTGLFGMKQLITNDGFRYIQEHAILRTDELMEEAISSSRKRKMVEIFDEISDTLCKVADLAEFVRIAHPEAQIRMAAEDACISISGMVEKLNTHRQLYKSLKNVTDNGDHFMTDAIDEHVSELFLFDFEQCGIHLEENMRRKVVYLNNCILQCGQKFMAGAVESRAVRKNMLPQRLHQFFPHDEDNLYISGLFSDSNDAQAREAAYKLFLFPTMDQEKLLHELIATRYELAKTCGFETYAHRVLKASTMETPENVNAFLDVLSTELRPRASKDFELMHQVKKTETGHDTPLAGWDVPYYTAFLKKQHLKVSPSEFAPYFSLGSCMEGLNNLYKHLFGITLENRDILPGEIWTSDVYKLAVVDENDGILGYIYCDFFERTGKPNQDCHFTIRGGKKLPSDEYQLPIVVVMLNLNIPRWSGPSLLSPAMVDNLFHEMGHAMHSMLARTRYQHVTGTRCSTDFAEVPSVLMEYFASDPRVLGSFAKHYQTQEPMPAEMLERLCDSKQLFSASETQSQVFYSALDQVYHGKPLQQGLSTTQVMKEVQGKYFSLPYVERTAWQLRFSHLVGYGAKYYSYLISRAIASWIWKTYFEKDPFSRDMGEKYRRECLAYGGEKPSRELVTKFLQRDITPDNLTKNLIEEIDANNDKIIIHLKMPLRSKIRCLDKRTSIVKWSKGHHNLHAGLNLSKYFEATVESARGGNFPYYFEHPIPLTNDCTPLTKNWKDIGTDIVEKSLAYHKELNILKERLVCNKKLGRIWNNRLKIRKQKSNGEGPYNIYPVDLLNYTKYLELNPHPEFEGGYNWYLTGGSLSVVQQNDKNYIVRPFGPELNHLDIIDLLLCRKLLNV
uniref:CSON013651 protein n=1 Tax=Culicoides sonorensis TaxID=179676 RepID=A0A336JW82_CULSO